MGKFLRNFGKERGITFVVTTHSPYMLDINHLDEVRIISENLNDKSAVIYNDFSISSKHMNNALCEIQKTLGVQISFDERLIFVEGLTDYHYLNAFKSIYEKEKKGKCNLVFLPVGGVGSYTGDKERDDKTKKMLAQNIIDLARERRMQPVLLVDGDKAGDEMKIVEDDEIFKDSNLAIISLKTIFENKYKQKLVIEDLFSNRIKFNIDSKSSINAKSFKNNENLSSEISDKSKNNFYELLEYLAKFEDKK